MGAADAWAAVIAEGFSPFKVICDAHRGSQMVRRGGARPKPDGGVELRWEVYRGRGAPVSGAGISDDDGASTLELTCPQCGQPRQFRRENLVRLLRERALAGQVDAKGRVVLNLADLHF
jgi:hypothetical protein